MGKPKKQFSKTISKATSDSSNPPKEKHVRGIISFFFICPIGLMDSLTFYSVN